MPPHYSNYGADVVFITSDLSYVAGDETVRRVTTSDLKTAVSGNIGR